MLGQQNNPDGKDENIIRFILFIAKLLFFVFVAMTVGMLCWIGALFICRACAYAYETWLSRPW